MSTPASHRVELPRRDFPSRLKHWLLAGAVVALVALYSVHVGQSVGVHKGARHCQKCQVDAFLALAPLDRSIKPVLLPRLSFYVEFFPLYSVPSLAPASLKPRSRAPPAAFS